MKMIPCTLLATGLALLLPGCVLSPAIPGNGTIVAEERVVSDFSAVVVSGSGRIELIQGGTEHLEVVTDENLLPHIESEVRGRTLHIGPTRNVRFSQPPRYTLELKQLEDLRLSGSMQARTAQLESDRLETRISGSGKVEIGNLEVAACKVDISGSGEVKIDAGAADSQELTISGSGDYRAADFQTADTQIRVSGSGSAIVRVREQLDVHISGSGHVDYYGSPSVTSHVSGSGRTRKLSD